MGCRPPAPRCAQRAAASTALLALAPASDEARVGRAARRRAPRRTSLALGGRPSPTAPTRPWRASSWSWRPRSRPEARMRSARRRPACAVLAACVARHALHTPSAFRAPCAARGHRAAAVLPLAGPGALSVRPGPITAVGVAVLRMQPLLHGTAPLCPHTSAGLSVLGMH